MVITDIYSAGESPIEGISGRSIYERLSARQQPKVAEFIPKKDIFDYVINILSPRDVILVLGAGDITKLSDELAQRIKG